MGAEVLLGRTTMVAKNMRKDAHMGRNHTALTWGRFEGDPVAVRKSKNVDVNNFFLFDMTTSNVHEVTNWCFDARFQGASLVTEVRCPLGAFFDDVLIGFAVIINADTETTLVHCNMDAKNLARGKLLSHLNAA